jgi:hypothetical protein
VGAATAQLNLQKLSCRLQVLVVVIVTVIVNAGFAVRSRDRDRASPDLVTGDPATPDSVTRLRRIS